MARKFVIAILACVAAAVPPAGAQALELEPVGTFSAPVFVTSEPGDPGRLLVVQQGGTIRLREGGTTSTFLDISGLISPGGEEGLLSMALAPDYAASKRFYVYYVDAAGDIQIDEFTASSVPVDLATRRPVLEIPHSNHANHNGGQLQFGPDGHLYIATGDGGGGGDPDGNGQDLSSLLGKLLRIDPTPGGPDPYAIPPGNPYAGPTAGADEIWSHGLRNPYRFSFDRATGAIAIADVGQAIYEEVDYESGPNAARGDNFGWNCREGAHPYTTTAPDASCADASGFTEPIFEYSHFTPPFDGACAVTGGYVVRDLALGGIYGRYLYADFCLGELRSFVPGPNVATCDRSEGLVVSTPSSFGEDSAGRIYVASLSTGAVYRLTGTSSDSCPPPAGGGSPDPVGTPDPMPQPQQGPPELRISAQRTQRLNGDAKLVCRLRADHPLDAVAHLALTRRGNVIERVGTKHAELAPGTRAKLRWTIGAKDLEAVRGALRRGRLEARFRARASDDSGAHSERVEAVSALRS